MSRQASFPRRILAEIDPPEQVGETLQAVRAILNRAGNTPLYQKLHDAIEEVAGLHGVSGVRWEDDPFHNNPTNDSDHADVRNRSQTSRSGSVPSNSSDQMSLMTERNTRDQTRASREKVEDERRKLNEFNNRIEALLQVYRVWKDGATSKDETLLELWDQLTDLPGAVNEVERQLAEHRAKGPGGRFHLRRGFLLNLPYAYSRHAMLPAITDCEEGANEDLPVRLQEVLDVLSRYHGDASRSFNRYRTTPGEVSDEEREEWMKNEGWSKRPHWIARVLTMDQE